MTSLLSIARVVIEALTPFTIGTGGGDDLRDSICATDANGLPVIPGSSIAGVLRRALPEDRRSDLFGFQSGSEGQASRVDVSWAQVHDENDRPVPFRGARMGGEVLAFLSTGVLRDHVRLNAQGAVDEAGKFDESLVPAGARFTFELSVAGATAKADLDELLAILASPALRFGGRSRRGFGRFAVRALRRRDLDLSRAADLTLLSQLPASLHDDGVSLDAASIPLPADQTSGALAVLRLTPEDYWLFGRGEAEGNFAETERAPDLNPVRERRIVWKNGRAHVGTNEILVPASGIKGALRHRVAYHARVARKEWVGPAAVDPPAMPEAATDLFGAIKDREEEGRPGKVFISDIFLADADAGSPGQLQHVCIDRFTSAPMDGMLFSEAPRFKAKEVKLEVRVDGASPESMALLKRALVDLAEGRLQLGGGGNRGHGYFSGKCEFLNWREA